MLVGYLEMVATIIGLGGFILFVGWLATDKADAKPKLTVIKAERPVADDYEERRAA